jgi:hypothetical protein
MILRKFSSSYLINVAVDAVAHLTYFVRWPAQRDAEVVDFPRSKTQANPFSLRREIA